MVVDNKTVSQMKSVSFFYTQIGKISIERPIIEGIRVEALTVINDKNRKQRLYLFFKRIIDIFCAIIGCLLLLPIAIVIKICYLLQGDKDSIFYVHERIGLNGKTFKMIKFRSMKMNSEKILKELLENDEKLRTEYEKFHKLENDPRITSIGEFIRKTSIDELPQFINVLKGEMSMVGPRPYLPREVKDMGEYYYNIIIQYKPAITGLWQVRGRSSTTFQDRLKFDYKYHDAFGLKQDFMIFIKTFSTILNLKGEAK